MMLDPSFYIKCASNVVPCFKYMFGPSTNVLYAVYLLNVFIQDYLNICIVWKYLWIRDKQVQHSTLQTKEYRVSCLTFSYYCCSTYLRNLKLKGGIRPWRRKTNMFFANLITETTFQRKTTSYQNQDDSNGLIALNDISKRTHLLSLKKKCMKNSSSI